MNEYSGLEAIFYVVVSLLASYGLFRIVFG